jgi:5-methyltetrahydrofolate--homocysteine methyltransferase
MQGIQVFEDYPLQDLIDYIDWTPFFQSWELAGKFPAILQDPIVGREASGLYEDAQNMLRSIVGEKWLTARAVIGIFPANSTEDDDILVYSGNARNEVMTRLHHLRQQVKKAAGQANLCLSDFIAPEGRGADYLGAFAVTAGIGIEEKVRAFEAAHDDYHAILLKALADRLAEALAERIHERVRREWWGYTPEEALNNEELIREHYRGIRPAPGYPACPEHSEKATLWQLLAPDRLGITLTENFAMYPAASVCGWYFSHPQARYFAVTQVDKDQLSDYARRKGWSLSAAERLLAPVLG